MKKLAYGSLTALLFVLLSYASASAQIVDKAKDIADKTKDVTVDAAKKTGDAVSDGAEKVADKSVEGAKVGASKTKKFGNTAVRVTENVAGQPYEGGKYFMVTTWDGTKWVSKRVWYNTKKGADVTRDAVTGKSSEKP